MRSFARGVRRLSGSAPSRIGAKRLPPPPPPPRDRRVVVTGMGMISPFGVGLDRTWEAIVSGATATRHVPALHEKHGLPVHVAAPVPRLGDGASDESTDRLFDTSRYVTNSRTQDVGFISLALGAATEALAESGVAVDSGFDPNRVGVALGAGVGSLSEVTSASATLSGPRGLRRLTPFFVPRTLVNLAAGHISMEFNLRGPNHCVATACATGAHAIGDAYRFVRNGDADAMLAGGTESTIDALSVAGFSRAKALSKCPGELAHEASRPFDADRDGFVMGEGAGVLVLEEYERAKARGAHIYAEVRGYGLSGDAHHITAPASDGDGAKRCMLAALRQAGVDADDIGYVNAHATSTPLGDAIEARAINAVMRGRRQGGGESMLRVSSTKGATGHLLGAAGAVEAIFAVKALETNVAPPTANLVTPDGGEGGLPSSLNLVPRVAQDMVGVRAVMTNSFGFGGTNASLVFGHI